MATYSSIKYDFTPPTATTSAQVGAGAMTLIKSIDASSDNTISFVDGTSSVVLDNTYKTYIFKLAERTKAEKDMGKPFDYNSTYNNALGSFTDSGPNGIIGLAFTDMAGDGRTKSFAEMYEEGLNDQSLYTHPETGQTLPKDITWMKDPENSDVLSQLLAKHVTNIMGDVYNGNRSPSPQTNRALNTAKARDLIKKYSS